jgi:hypothetical protein
VGESIEVPLEPWERMVVENAAEGRLHAAFRGDARRRAE